MDKKLKVQYMDTCMGYFGDLAQRLKESHELVTSINKDGTLYLIPRGTITDISYYGKPIGSFRVSDHWNWWASYRKCVDFHHVQCFSKDLHRPFRRNGVGLSSTPVMACCVGYYGPDRLYHIVCGEVWDQKTRKSTFIMRDINEVLSEVGEDLMDINLNGRKTA